MVLPFWVGEHSEGSSPPISDLLAACEAHQGQIHGSLNTDNDEQVVMLTLTDELVVMLTFNS